VKDKWKRATFGERTCLLLALPTIALAYLLVYVDQRTGAHPVLGAIGGGLSGLGAFFIVYFFLGERGRANKLRRQLRKQRQ